MDNAKEHEDEKAQPVPHPSAMDLPIDTQQHPNELLDNASPLHPVPMDQDESILSENGKAIPNDNDTLKCNPHQSHSEAPSNDNGLESKSSLQQSETYTILGDKPQKSHIETIPNDSSLELKASNQQPLIERLLDENAALNTPQEPQTESVVINNSVELNSDPQQSRAEAFPNVDNIQLKVSPQKPDSVTSPNANGVDLKSSLKQHQTEVASSDDNVELKCSSEQLLQGSSAVALHDDKSLHNIECQAPALQEPKAAQISDSKSKSGDVLENAKPAADAKIELSEAPESMSGHHASTPPGEHGEPATPAASSSVKSEVEAEKELKSIMNKTDIATPTSNGNSSSKHSFLLDQDDEGNESGTEEKQLAFMKEIENFFRERSMEFKPPKFYGEGLNCLKLWRAVMKLGGYDKVTSCKLWRQVGESFKPPKTCTTVSWTFRGFYEKALLDYERQKTNGGELNLPSSEPMNVDNQGSGSGRARRDAAARAMQGWHSRLLGNREVSDPVIKDKNSTLQKREKQFKSAGLLKRKKPSDMEDAVNTARTKTSKLQLDVEVVDLGPPADWVKINVQKTKDCFEVYALVPGLLREEVRVQSDPAGRLVISGEPEHPDNPWGVTPFKKVVSLPSRIDPHQTSAVVTLHGQLFARVPFEQSD